MSKLNTTPVDWQTELNAAAYKYHVLIAWVGVFLNPIWAIGDYFNSPDHFNDFFIFRIVVSALTFIGLLFRKKLVDHPWIIVFIPFAGIAIQNAYMYSVMSIDELRKHTFAYIALFIGAGMFVLWKPIYSVIVVLISFIFNIVLFAMYGHLKVSDVLINGGMLTASVALFTILLIHTRTNLTKKEIIARLALAESNNELAVKNEIIEEKNKDISDSINYAQRIQQAMLPPFEKLDHTLKEYFVLYKPKDVVSGDFYWYTSIKQTTAEGSEIAVIAAVDCTGHGVPGALMSIIGSTVLNQTIANAAVSSPSEALSFLNREITRTLNSIKDGMDIALCTVDPQKMELQFAGANNPVYIIRKKELIEIKADKMAIGADSDNAAEKIFTNHIFPLENGDSIYLFTDGFADQFGGPQGKKMKSKKFQEILMSIQDKQMAEQKIILERSFLEWKGALNQVDDVLVIGIRV